MALEWQDKRTDEPGYRSTCNRYMVAQDDNALWQAWKLAPFGSWFRPLKSGLLTEQEARTAAQEDADTCLVRA